MKLGYAQTSILPLDFENSKYYVAGFVYNTVASSCHDELKASCVYLENKGKGIALVSLDLLGFLYYDVKRVRQKLKEWSARVNCMSVNIMCIHNHSSIDTIGLFGDMGVENGRNENYIDFIIEKIEAIVIEAYSKMKQGKIYTGCGLAKGLVIDAREPFNEDERITKIKFVPTDGSKNTEIYHFTCHPECMGPFNTEVCADFKYYWEKQVCKENNCNFIFFNGALGGMQTVPKLFDDSGNELVKRELTREMGKRLAECSLDISNEKLMEDYLQIKQKALTIPLDNINYMGLIEMGMFNKNFVSIYEKSATGLGLETEVSILNIGSLTFCLIPGEIFNELINGKYLQKDLRVYPNMEPETPLIKALKNENLLVMGLANDEIGYIMPQHDFYVNDTWSTTYDEHGYQTSLDDKGRNHYEEVNSSSKYAAKYILDAITELANN